MAVIDRVGQPNLQLQLDLYHVQIMEGDLAHQIRALAGRYPHIQIAGNPGRHEPDIGEINYPFLFDLFDEIGYAGWIGCEYRPQGETLAGLGWAAPYGIRLTARAPTMRIVITGGCGFLGRRVAMRLLEHGSSWARSTNWCCSTTRRRPCRCPRTRGSRSSPATSPTAKPWRG